MKKPFVIYKIGQVICHRGNNENAHVIYTGVITGFDGLAIRFKRDFGPTYLLNRWEIMKPKKETVKH